MVARRPREFWSAMAGRPPAASRARHMVRQPLRVLEVLATSTPGGGPKHVWDLVRHLPKDEFEPIIAAPRDGLLFDRFRDSGIRVVELPRRRLGWRHFFLTARLISNLRVDIVHTHGKGPGLYGRLAARWSGVPAVHTFHGLHYSAYSPVGQRTYVTLERALSRSSCTIINVSASQHAEALRLRLFRPEQGVVIVNGVDLDEMERRIAQSTTCRETLGLTSDDIIVGSISRFDPIKQIEVLVEAVRLLKPRLPHLTLVLVGGGKDEDRIRRLVFENKLEQSVIFTGSLPNAAHMYRVFDLYIAASRKEGLPLSLVEAMAAGLPVVATNVPGHRDVVVHGETGLLIPPGDTPALANAVASLVSNPARCKAMGEAGRWRARKEFSVHSMAEATACVYREAARRQNRIASESQRGRGRPGGS
jgi:glycosyltransferase involved in cell wall biosynthesis